MNSKDTLTVLTVLALCVLYTQGASIGETRMNLRCQCIKTHSKFIHHKFINNVEIIPKGPHCANIEIIITVKNAKRVCLQPEALWVKKLIGKMIKNSKMMN
ncbi:interleukin-8-like [Mustelus asterias]